MNAQRLQPIHMDCGETSMRLTHQNRLEHLVPSLSHIGVNQDTHMLGACHASFNHINIRALVSTISTSRPYDLTCFCTSKKLLQEPNEVNYGERCCESVFLQERIEVNASDTPKTYHECYCYTPHTPPHPRANTTVYLSLPCRFFLSEEVASCCFFLTGLGNPQT